MEDKIIIYQTEDGQTQIDVRVESETVWLSANQMAVLFDRDAKTVRKHINNVFEEKEVPQDNNTHFLRVDGVKQPVAYYSLDVIISVGYRVKSKRGTDFRIWARMVLKQYLIKGFAVNDRIRQEQIGELRQLVQVVGRAITNQEVPNTIESQDLLNVVVDYSYALDTLDNYDYERLTIDDTTKEEPFHATYENAMQEIVRLRDKFGGSTLFGNEKDDSFKSSIGQIYQTFGGEGRHAALPRDEEPFVQRRQQAHCRHALPVVPQQQRHPLPRRRQQASGRQHPRCPDPDDCREQDGGKGRDGESRGEPD